jgi:hypothetical protein
VKSKKDPSAVICYNCRKPGHYARDNENGVARGEKSNSFNRAQ